MDSRVSRSYLLIPIVYVLLIGALLYLQFAREVPFHTTIGALSVSGATRVGREGDLARVAVRIGGLSFLFGPANLVRVASADGSEQAMTVRSYAPAPGGLTLSFDNGISLRFALGSDGGATVTPSAPQQLDIATISIPYSTDRNALVHASLGLPVLSVSTADGSNASWVLTLPFRSRIAAADHRLVFASNGGAFEAAHYDPMKSDDLVADWFRARAPLPDDSTVKQALSDYLAKAWNGLTATRFNIASGTWIMRSGSPAFSDDALAMVLSESLERGAYGTILPIARGLAAAHEPSILTAPFIGDLPDALARSRAGDVDRLTSIHTRLSSGDLTLFADPDLLPFVLDRGSSSLAQQLYQAMLSVRPQTLSASACAGLLGGLLEAHQSGLEVARSIEQAGAVVTGCLFPFIARTPSGLFLATDGNRADVATSIEAGSLLARYGAVASDSTLSAIGGALVASALALSDPDGFLPERVVLNGEEITGTEGFVAPERIYRLLSGGYTAKEVPILESTRAGDWILAASRVGSVQVSPQSMLITFDFAPGATEYIAVIGITAPTALKLYGQEWHTDPQYDQYQAGWTYDAASSTLIVKLLHQQREEQVEIDF